MTEFSDIPEQPYDWQNVPHVRGGNRVTRNKLNPVAIKVPRVSSASGKTGSALSAASAASGPDADNGYWNLVVGAMFLLFLLYVVAHNELQTWANILFWKPAAPVQVAAAAASPASSPASAGTASTIGALAGAGASQSSALGLGSLFGTVSGGLQGAAISTPGIIGSIPNAVTSGTGLATPATPSGSGAGGMLGSGFWNGPVGTILKKFGY